MDECCSVGQIVSEVCHKTFYGPISRNLKKLNDFDESVQNCLNLG